MMRKRCVFWLALMVLGGICRADVKVSVEQITYRGWRGSYRLTVGTYSLVVVPQIGGRIMEYSLGGRNVMWENRAEYGKLYSIEKVWRNFGGYKTWNSPEDRWGWPPDPILDAGPATIEIKQADGLPTLRIIGAPSLESGIVFTKDVTLSPDGRVRLVQRMHNISGAVQTYGVWDVTQVRTPCFVAFPVRKESKFPNGFKPMMKDSGKSKQWASEDGLCIVDCRNTETGQIGADSPGPWMVWFKDNLAYVKLFGDVKDFSAYPDDGCSIELFTSKPELGYLEMEIMGPVVSLQPGGETSLPEDWIVCTLDAPVRDRPAVKRAVEELQRRKVIQ